MILSGGLHYYYSLNADKWSSGGSNTQEQRHRCTYLSKVTGSIQALSMLLSVYSFRFVFIESCKYIIVNQSEATAFCSKLSSCGLTIASVYSVNWIGVSCVLVLGILGLVIVTVNAIHLPLLLLNDLYITLMGPFELNRLGILTKHSYELALALETASTEFINCYLTDWQRIQRRQAVNNIRAISTAAYNYGALDDLYQDDDHCSECHSILFAYNGSWNLLQLQCGHMFHQVCILIVLYALLYYTCMYLTYVYICILYINAI